MEQCRRGGCGFRCEHIQSHTDLCTHTQSASENEREFCRQMGALWTQGTVSRPGPLLTISQQLIFIVSKKGR